MSQPATVASVQEFLTAELVDLGVEEETINADMRLDEMDVDSLDVVDLMTAIKKGYGVDIPRRDLVGITLLQLIEQIISEIAAPTA